MKKQEKLKDILIVGVGNILLGDEGIGVHVIRKLQKINLPDNVELLDIGVDSFSLILHASGRKKIIIIDAVKSGSDAGNVYRLSTNEIEREKDKFLSLHQIGIGDILTYLALLQTKAISAEIVIIGIEPSEIKWGIELSPCLKEKMPQIINAILKEISLG